jgi:hypothetical protein
MTTLFRITTNRSRIIARRMASEVREMAEKVPVIKIVLYASQ